MVRQVATRSQRRMEKKQAVVLLVLILAVSLVSFTLGVMVGRSGSRTAAVPAAAPVRLPVAQAAPEPAQATTPEGGERPAEKLTFYDSLPKGEEPPMGSGINLPPKKETPQAPTANSVAKEPLHPAPAAAASPALPPAKAVSAAPAAGGEYLVQAAAFRRKEDARVLKERLGSKGYSAFTQEVDLAEKGTWHRVFVGPYPTAAAAEAAVGRLKAEEKLAALVRKR